MDTMATVVIKPLLTVTIGILALLPVQSSHAVVTVQGYWTMGSDDPGAAAGGAVTSTEDISGNGLDLIKKGSGSLLYSSNVPSSEHDPADPSLSIISNGASSGVYLGQTGNTTYNYANNFGVQLWVKTDLASSGTQFLTFNGNTAGYGWGILQQANTYQVLLGGVRQFGSTPAVTGEWIHLALVVDQSFFGVRFYVNGVVNDTATGVSPFQTTGQSNEWFTVGAFANGGNNASASFADVQVFTFAPGQFNASTDLLYTVPEPSTWLLATGGGGRYHPACPSPQEGRRFCHLARFSLYVPAS